MSRHRRRGLALADFLAGMLIFSATLGVFAELTRSKFEMLGAAEQRACALAAAEEAVDRIRREGLPKAPRGRVDELGFRRVMAFTPAKEARLSGGQGVIEARSLRLKTGGSHGLYEVRVTVRWLDSTGGSRLELSTVATLPGGGR